MDAAPPARASAPAWAAISAWGAGLLELALGAGMMTSAGDAARGAGVALVIIGAGGIGWGAVTLARGRVVAPRAGVTGSLVGLIAAVVALGVDPARTSVVAVAAASVLFIAVALLCGLVLRRGSGANPSTQTGLVALLIAGFVVAAVVTPALGATEAGHLAPDHSEHGLVVPGHRH